MIVATFSRPATTMAGTQWRVIGFNTGNAFMSSLNTERMTASFNPNGQLSGFAGCNDYSAQYTLNPTSKTMTVKKVVSTKRLCPQSSELMQEEAGFLKAWTQVQRYERSSDTLTLYNNGGIRVLSFSLAR